MDKVLMIDDEKEIIDFFAEALSGFKNVQFLSAVRAVQGLELARTEKPGVILLDLKMPGMDGEDALKTLKRELPGTKFIVLTAWNDGMTKERILKDIGVDAYYEKPVELEQVITKIINLLMVKD